MYINPYFHFADEDIPSMCEESYLFNVALNIKTHKGKRKGKDETPHF